MVVTEALARGLPVVAADVGGLSGGPRSRRRRDAAGAAGPARRPRGARRCAAGLARRRRPQRPVAPGGPRAARVARPVVDHDGRPRRCPGGCCAMTVEEIRVSSGMACPARARRRRGPCRRPRRAPRAPPPGSRPPVIHDLGCGTGGDGPLARAAAARAAALGRARPGRRSAGAWPSPTCPARPPTGPRSPSRRGSPTSPGCSRMISTARRSSPPRRCWTC